MRETLKVSFMELLQTKPVSSECLVISQLSSSNIAGSPANHEEKDPYKVISFTSKFNKLL